INGLNNVANLSKTPACLAIFIIPNQKTSTLISPIDNVTASFALSNNALFTSPIVPLNIAYTIPTIAINAHIRLTIIINPYYFQQVEHISLTKSATFAVNFMYIALFLSFNLIIRYEKFIYKVLLFVVLSR